jgi:hypothetical protein
VPVGIQAPEQDAEKLKCKKINREFLEFNQFEKLIQEK